MSLVARQRDLRELVGETLAAGAVQTQFADALKHWEARFHKIVLEDRNLPTIAEKRILRPVSPEAKAAIDGAFAELMSVRRDVLETLLTEEADRDMFRKVMEGEHQFGGRNFLELVSTFTTPPLLEVRFGAAEIGFVVPFRSNPMRTGPLSCPWGEELARAIDRLEQEACVGRARRRSRAFPVARLVASVELRGLPSSQAGVDL